MGNSSVAIRECSFLGVPAVNVGTRQMGRERGQNVIDVDHEVAVVRVEERDHVGRARVPRVRGPAQRRVEGAGGHQPRELGNRLGQIHPLPQLLRQMVVLSREHLGDVDRVLVVEELTPFLEDELRARVRDEIETWMKARDPATGIEITLVNGFPGFDTPPDSEATVLAKRLDGTEYELEAEYTVQPVERVAKLAEAASFDLGAALGVPFVVKPANTTGGGTGVVLGASTDRKSVV